MHTWPALRYLAAAVTRATVSTSTSAKTTTGECPPSSIVTCFMPSAAMVARCVPTGIDPVNEIVRITGDGIRCSDTWAGTPKTTFTTPLGTPASSHSRTMAMAVPGVSSAGLTITEQPAASAVATLRPGIRAGKFHGENAATGPMGW